MSKKAPKSKEEQTYNLRDIVLAKLRGYPAWPAMVVDPERVPLTVQKERPGGKKQSFYCVRFFPAGDYSWVMPKDMSKLRQHEIETYINEPHKKNGDLLNGYRIALDPQKWEQELEERQAMAVEAEEEAEVDELDGEDEVDEDEKPVKPRKRKRESEAGATKGKPGRPRKERRLSETVSKPRKSSTEKISKRDKNGPKSNAVVESEDEGEHAEDAGPSKKASPPPTARKSKKEKDGEEGDTDEKDPEAVKVKEWRHKFQKGFLGKTPAKAEDMPPYDVLFTTVEDYDMPLKYLQSSKIGKVMRHIAQKDGTEIPRDDEFKFRDRAQALVNKWAHTLSSTNGRADSKKPVSKPDTTMGTGDAAIATESVAKNDAMDVELHGNGIATADAAINGSKTIDQANGDINMEDA